jgi:hypothetical protein
MLLATTGLETEEQPGAPLSGDKKNEGRKE